MSAFKPTDFMILKILLPLTKRTWATPCESLNIIPKKKDNLKKLFTWHKKWIILNLPIWEGVNPFFPNFLIWSLTSSALSFNHDGTDRRYGNADWEIPLLKINEKKITKLIKTQKPNKKNVGVNKDHVPRLKTTFL